MRSLACAPFALSCVLVLASCTSSPPALASAAVNGEVDLDARWPGVVGMQIRKPEGIATCTGVLIAPNLLLTARHCVSSTRPALVCGSSPLSPPVEGRDVLSTNEVTIMDTSAIVRTLRVEVPSEGDDECGFDIAAVILAEEFVGATIYPPRLDRPVVTAETFSAIGYGTTGSGGVGTRRFLGDVSVACVGGVDCEIPEVQPTEWVSSDDAFCRSDSGAPAIDAEGRVIGIVSKGINPCGTPILTSTYAFRDWIRSVGLMAAEEGGYAPPEWTRVELADAGVEEDASPSVSDAGPAAPMDSGGCAISASPRAAVMPLVVMFGALAFLVRRR